MSPCILYLISTAIWSTVSAAHDHVIILWIIFFIYVSTVNKWECMIINGVMNESLNVYLESSLVILKLSCNGAI